MIVDGCSHSFNQLAAAVFPGYLRRLRDAIAAPWETALFAKPGRGTAWIAGRVGLKGDFPGCYVLIEPTRPVYVGISRTVLARVRQHVIGSTHFEASLPYLMAKRLAPTACSRDEAMRNGAFRAVFEAQQQRLRDGYIAAVRIDNALERHLFEVYGAMALGTGEWNTFDTH